MGKVLQIRVSAVTWDKDLIEEYWPRVAELAFSVPVRLADRGLLEMVRALEDGLEFAKWPEARKEALGPGIRKCAHIRADLEKALADWQPGRANELGNQLEDALDELERKFV